MTIYDYFDYILYQYDQYPNFQVTCLSACGEECVIATKVNTAVDK